MATVNDKRKVKTKTHEGAVAKSQPSMEKLRRTVLSCMLWERSFYEEGEHVADRISNLVHQVNARDAAELAIEARTEYKLRHAPLWILVALLSHPQRGNVRISDYITSVISRADEITEVLAMYWKDGKKPLAKQLKKGLADAFHKFDEYQFAKYNRKTEVRLRDVMFLVHPKPRNSKEKSLFKRIANDALKTPDTWEVALSGGGDKKTEFTRLLSENKLGYMALLRNLCNMEDVGVDKDLIKDRLLAGASTSKALPFRFVAAASHAPGFEQTLDKAMMKALASMDKLPGKTRLLVDTSGSMRWFNTDKSSMTMLDRGAALAALVAGIAEDFEAWTFESNVHKVPSRQGMALVDKIKSMPSGGTNLGKAVRHVDSVSGDYDRLIVFTDEQSHDPVGSTKNSRGYMINVASYENGVGYGRNWTHINGFSESVIDFIQELEKLRT